MFSRQRAYDMRSGYRSRYNAMIDSRELEDKANAEVCRLASQAWEYIALHFNRPFDGNPANNLESPSQEQIVDWVVHDMEQRWEEYCRTGVARNEVDELAEELRDNFPVFVRLQREAAIRNAETVARGTSNAVLATPLSSQSNQKGKKGKPNGLQELKEPAVAPAPKPEKINEAILPFIQVDAMKEIVKELYEELSMEQPPEMPEEVDGPESVEFVESEA